MEVTIRPAGGHDLPALVRFGGHFVAAAPYGGQADRPSILRTLQLCIDSGLSFVAETATAPVGGLVGMGTPLWYDNATRVATEMAWWVEPEYRTTTAGPRLLSAFERRAKELGYKYCTMMCMMTTPDGAKLDRIYQRRGFRLVEQAYLKELS